MSFLKKELFIYYFNYPLSISFYFLRLFKQKFQLWLQQLKYLYFDSSKLLKNKIEYNLILQFSRLIKSKMLIFIIANLILVIKIRI